MNETEKLAATRRKYSDIIDIKHFDPKNHPRMSTYKRAAQFAPFAALTGYEELVEETSRLTSEKLNLSEDEKSVINKKLLYIKEHLKEFPLVSITYFEKDKYKDGGAYITVKDSVKKIDDISKLVILSNLQKIKINDIINIIIFM